MVGFPISLEVILIFDWLGDLIIDIGDAIGGLFSGAAEAISEYIFDALLQWIYNIIYNAVSEFFTMIGNFGAEIFELPWIRAFIQLFTLLGWALFAVGTVVAVFDVAIEYQNGRANIKSCCLNILKGFFACSLITVVPIELYKFCITLQNSFAGDLTGALVGSVHNSLSLQALMVLQDLFTPNETGLPSLLIMIAMITFAVCIIKVFFANIKRGGVLLTQIAVGALYMFSVPRGYTDGFFQWCKQVIALCLTAFLQTTLLFLGLLTMPTNMLLGLGIMLAANEGPRIAQQFGLDTSVHVHMMSVVHATSMAVNVGKSLVKTAAK